MVTTRDNYEHFIHEVESCSIAEHAGLQIGDHIETINGIRIVEFDCEFHFLILFIMKQFLNRKLEYSAMKALLGKLILR